MKFVDFKPAQQSLASIQTPYEVRHIKNNMPNFFGYEPSKYDQYRTTALFNPSVTVDSSWMPQYMADVLGIQRSTPRNTIDNTDNPTFRTKEQEDFQKQLDYINENNYWMDDYGRVWVPGSTIEGEGGKWELTAGEAKAIYYNPETFVGGETAPSSNISWVWKPSELAKVQGTATFGKPFGQQMARPDSLAMLKAGVWSPGPDKGSGWGKGISTGLAAFGPMLGAGAMGVAGQVAGGAGSAAQGAYNTYQAAESGDTVGAIGSGLKTLAGVYNTGSNIGGGDSLGGGNMDYELNSDFNLGDYSQPDFGYDTGLDTSLGDAGSLDYSGGGGGGWFDSADWGNIIKTGAGIGLGIYGQLSNNAASRAGQAGLEAAAAAQQRSKDEVTQLQREQFEYQKRLNQPFYDKGLAGFDQYQSAITGTPMANGKVYNPIQNPAYDWQQQQLTKNLGRTLRNLGRENSTYGMNVMGDQQRSLAASEFDKQLNRLSSLTDVARGGSAALTNASNVYGTNTGNLITSNAENQANASLAGGLQAQNTLYNNQQNLMSLANLGLKAFGNNGNWSTGG